MGCGFIANLGFEGTSKSLWEDTFLSFLEESNLASLTGFTWVTCAGKEACLNFGDGNKFVSIKSEERLRGDLRRVADSGLSETKMQDFSSLRGASSEIAFSYHALRLIAILRFGGPIVDVGTSLGVG